MKDYKWIIVALIILIGVIYVLNTCKDTNTPTEIPDNDTTYVYGDTLIIYEDTLWSVKWKTIPAVTTVDSTGMVTKSISEDTLLVMDKDSIKVKVDVDYYPSEDKFDLGIDVHFRGYESVRVDTMKINNYVPVPVPINEPFYDEFEWGAGVATVIWVAVMFLIGK